MDFRLILLFVAIIAFIVMVFDTFMPDKDNLIIERLKSLKLINASDNEKKMNEPLLTRIYMTIEKLILRHFGEQLKNSASLAPLRIKLIRAGTPDIDPVSHRAKRFIFALAGAGIGLIISNFSFAAFLAGMGYLYPDYKLKGIIEKRQTQMKEEIPEFLDLLAAVFPGTKGFEDAVMRICLRSEGIITKEFETVIEEINAGKRKKAALLAMAERCGVKEIDTLISQIVQSEMLGTGLEDTLNMQAAKLRELKKQISEKKAIKASIQLLFPSIFLLMTIMIIIAGPSILQFTKAMSML